MSQVKSILSFLFFALGLCAGSFPSSASIYAPAIVQQPTNISVRAGEWRTVFTVEASGGTPFTYYWRKETNVVEVSPWWHYNIESVQFGDAGNYSVIVSNYYGSVTSAVVTLTVEPAGVPAAIYLSYSSAGFYGSEATLGVSATGTEPIYYQWSREGNDLANETNATLRLRLFPENLGPYTVRVWNQFGSTGATLEPVMADVREGSSNILRIKPRIDNPLQPVTHVTTNRIRFEGGLSSRTFYRGVYVQNNTNAFVRAEPIYPPGMDSLYPSWFSEIDLIPGTNILRVKAVDSGGRSTLTNSRVVIYDVLRPLRLEIEGSGMVYGAQDGDPLVEGQAYTLKAQPAPGFRFREWTGSVTSSLKTLRFVMESNTTLIAHFEENPFPALAGSYIGLFSKTDLDLPQPVPPDSFGIFSCQVRHDGSFSALLRAGGKKKSFVGRFDFHGHFVRTIQLPDASAVTLNLQLNFEEKTLTGVVGSETWNSDLFCYRAANEPSDPSLGSATNYTVLIPGSQLGATSGIGDSFATLEVNTRGVATVSGELADGVRLVHKVGISARGEIALYAPSSEGALWALLQLRRAPDNDVTGPFWWFRSPGRGLFPEGFTVSSEVTGSVWEGLASWQSGQAILSFSGGNLSAPFTGFLLMGLEGGLVIPEPERIRLSFRKTGRFFGQASAPGATEPLEFRGVLLSPWQIGRGYFLGTNESGRVTLDWLRF